MFFTSCWIVSLVHLVCLSLGCWKMERLSQSVSDPNLRHILSFGIGLHHAGLQEKDRKLVEELFFNQKIQVSRAVFR